MHTRFTTTIPGWVKTESKPERPDIIAFDFIILNLNNETIFVNGNDVLAMEGSVKWEIKLMRRIAGMVAGGLFNIRLSGTGMVFPV